MLTNNPFAEVSATIPPSAMQTFVVVMFLLVVAGTIFDVIHKKSAKYFFENMKREKAAGSRQVGGGEKVGIAVATAAHDVLASGEFCNPHRRLAHLITMYGFILFVITSCTMIFGYAEPGAATPAIHPLLWHLGALMVCVGGYWFWFFIRVDVAAEGHSPFRFMPADLFVVSLVACTTFALIWSFFVNAGAGTVSWVFFLLFIAAALVLFGGVPWSKFAHMFFKPAAAYQKRVADADGSRSNLPPPVDAPAKFGLGIKRDLPRHY
ncbi:MAG: adenylyl-sulfate reductase [Gammaproteobacteria bacterium]|nr:adenylyl-sulfate reductase [Gammaproteobacteria bacterium]MXY65455.1 adenylyl-sulfate reductase [Gammaproteobacteria bacterium]MYG66229.1 adenylyl-sulfate reductase [Gammaproteobacteria bacterium]